MGRLAVSELTTYRWSFEEDVRAYGEAGYDGIAVWRQKLSDYGEEKGAELLAETGLQVTSLWWTGAFTGSDGRSFDECVTDAKEALQLAQLLGARYLLVHSGGRNGHTKSHSRRLLLEGLRAVLPLAEEFGVTLLLEPMPPGCAGPWTFLTSLDDARELIDTVDSDFVKVALDTYLFGHERRLPRRMASLVDYLGVVHLADASDPPCPEVRRRRLGRGHLPLAEILGALHDAGFDGDYEVEIMGEEIEGADYFQLLTEQAEAFRTLWRECAAAP